MSAVYQHPDGHEINIARRILTATNSDGESVSMPIGEGGLLELGKRLIDLSEAEFNEGDCAEQAGAAIGLDLLDALMAVDNQALRGQLIQAAIVNLAKLQHLDRAAAGFAVAMVNVLEIGLQHLPKVSE